MGCNTCGEQKPKKDACAFTKATVQINNPKELALFRKVVVPASLGDDTQYPPKVGKYCNVILYYEANDQVYLYSSDGIPTRITVDITELKRQIKKVKDDLATEVENRETADQEIWTEIETIEAASDVVDVVGTYAELQQYDTSKLHDNDLIKVLQDETRDDAITYYRWNGSAFTYVGAEGPYYTASETDTLLAAKQDTLIAGANIQIAADGKTISATDTTYTHFTGATASTDGVQGLVPGPLAGDENKVLKGDGTWQDGYDRVALYITNMPADLTTPFYIYKDSSRQQPITWSEMRDLLKVSSGKEVVLWLNNSGDDIYHVVKYCDDTTEFYIVDPDTVAYYYIQANADDPTQTQFSIESVDLQKKLTAGTNISISNQNVISATDTTYTDFIGASAYSAGSEGLVPAPSAGDQDKVLRGDGTWGTVSGSSIVYYDYRDVMTNPSGTVSFYPTDSRTPGEEINSDDLTDMLNAGPVILIGEFSGEHMCVSLLSSHCVESDVDYESHYVSYIYNYDDNKVYLTDFQANRNSDDTFDYTMTAVGSGSARALYYDYDTVSAAASGASTYLYTEYDISRGLDGRLEHGDDLGDLLTEGGIVYLVGVYEDQNSQEYYIKTVNTSIAYTGASFDQTLSETPSISIYMDQLSPKAIWRFYGPAADSIYIEKTPIASASPITLFYINGTLASKGSNYFSIYSDAAMTQSVTYSAFGEAVRDGVVRLIYDNTSDSAHYDYDIYLYKDVDHSYSGMESPTYYVYDGNTRSIRTIEFNGPSGAHVTNDLPLSANNISSNDWSGLWQ